MHLLTLPDARTRDLPIRWGEVTLGQSARLAELPEGADVYSFLSTLLDLSPLEVMNLPADFINAQVLPVLGFTTDELPDFGSHPLPPSLILPFEFGERQLPVPPVLDLVTFGQATDLGAVLQDAAMPVPQKRMRALAIVFYPSYVRGDYDSDAIEAFAADVCSHAMLEDALPITDFFLRSTTSSAGATSPSSSASPSALTSEPPASKPWWRSGMRWLWSTRWPLATKPAGPTSGGSPGAR